MSQIFQFQSVTKRFGQQTALDQFTLDGPRGTVIALLGENGAGKTTALKILLGLELADSGESQVLGMNSRHQGQEIRRKVGYVADRPSLYEWMTVDEIGWFAAGFYDHGFYPKYQELVAGFELPRNKKLKTLSKGMHAKVALSLALAHEPELLVLDEPTSGLDAMVRREFLESMVDIAATDRTVLLSSHQINEVERVADVVAILRHGKLVAVENVHDLKQEVRELTVTLNNGAIEIPTLPTEIISRTRQDRQWRILARKVDEGHLTELRNSAHVRHVECRTPSLEDIFVTIMHADDAIEHGGRNTP